MDSRISIVALNTASNVLLMACQLLATFIITPVYVRALGNHDYGIWEIVASLAGYMGLLDLGLSPTVSRFTAKYHAESDAEGFRSLIATSGVALILAGLVAMAIIVGWATLGPQALAEAGHDTTRYTIFLALVAIQVGVSIPGHVPEAALEGLQLYWAKNAVTAINVSVGSVITYCYIEHFDPLIFLAAANCIGVTLKYIIFALMMRSRVPRGSRPLWRSATRNTLVTIARFGSKSFVQGLASSFASGAPPIVIGAMIGPASVPFYSLPANLIKQIRFLSWNLTHAFMPHFAALHARHDLNGARSSYLASSRLIVAVLAPLSVGATLLGPEFLTLWIGPDFGMAAVPLLPWIALYFLLPGINPMSSRYLTAIGQHGFLARVYPVGALLAVAAGMSGGYFFGLLGLTVGMCLPGLVVVPMVLRKIAVELGVTATTYARSTLLPLVPALGVMIIIVETLRRWNGQMDWLELVLAVLLAGSAYLVMLWFTGLTSDDRIRLTSLFRRD